VSWLLRLYPANWRRRYGEEFAALVESQPRSLRVVVDVLLGAFDAWLRPQLGPRHSAAQASGGLFRRQDRFDRFTPRSRSALRQAQTEAESYQHGFIGTEHLLLGLLHDPDNLAMRVLRTFGIESATVRAAVEHQVSAAPTVHHPARGLTDRSKRVIELSVEEAKLMRHSWVGTEHLLLGLLHEGGGTAATALRDVGCADLDELRRVVVLMIEGRK
jgi:hypothetical protein